MSATEVLLRQPAAQAIAWALLHFVWQGALIGVLTAVALAALKRSAADVRYVVATIALSLMLTMPVVTAVQSWRAGVSHERGSTAFHTSPVTSTSPAHTDGFAGVGGVSQPSGGEHRTVTPAPIVDAAAFDLATIERWLPALLLAWLAGVSLLTLRLLSGWLWVQRLRTHGGIADDTWQQMAARLCRRLHITRRVRLLESSLVEVPTVIGWMQPVILLPGSVLAGLSPQQLEAILAHELAHIRRHDYLVNLVQTLVETLLFYHPAVWWLSGRIRAEREHCCDDLAVSLCGDPYTYASALADLEEQRGPRGRLALAATGGSLLQRVRRLLGAPASHAGRGPGWLAGTAAVLVLGGIVFGALGHDVMRAQQAAIAPVAGTTQGTPGAAVTVEAVSRRRLQHGELMHLVLLAAKESATTRTPEARETWRELQRIYATVPGADNATEAELFAAADAMRRVLRRRASARVQDPPAPVPVSAAAPVETAVEPVLATAPLVATRPAMPAPVVASAERVEAAVAAVVDAQETSGNFTWSNNGEKLQVNFRGDVEFTDDDSDVKRLSPGGYLKITDGGRLRGRTIEFRADASGNLERRYRVGTSERPFEPEGRQWLAQVLPRFIRQTGMGAERRVARILKASGPSGVLAEISRIEGGWAKRVYFKELVRQARPDAATARQILTQAGREIDSDYELASLLLESADTLLVDEAARKAYFEAARTIESDYEMRRVFAGALKRAPMTTGLLTALLDTSRSIDSDFELAELLVQVSRNQALDAAASRPFFAAAETIENDYEQRRVLGTLAAGRELTPETMAALLTTALDIGSDFELAELLSLVVKQHEVEGPVRAPFFRAVDSIESGYERSRVLRALARKSTASADTVTAILKSVRGVGSHEASQVLLTVAASHPISGAARDLYIDAAGELAEYEQGRVLTALVKSERRK